MQRQPWGSTTKSSILREAIEHALNPKTDASKGKVKTIHGRLKPPMKLKNRKLRDSVHVTEDPDKDLKTAMKKLQNWPVPSSVAEDPFSVALEPFSGYHQVVRAAPVEAKQDWPKGLGHIKTAKIRLDFSKRSKRRKRKASKLRKDRPPISRIRWESIKELVNTIDAEGFKLKPIDWPPPSVYDADYKSQPSQPIKTSEAGAEAKKSSIEEDSKHVPSKTSAKTTSRDEKKSETAEQKQPPKAKAEAEKDKDPVKALAVVTEMPESTDKSEKAGAEIEEDALDDWVIVPQTSASQEEKKKSESESIVKITKSEPETETDTKGTPVAKEKEGKKPHPLAVIISNNAKSKMNNQKQHRTDIEAKKSVVVASKAVVTTVSGESDTKSDSGSKKALIKQSKKIAPWWREATPYFIDLGAWNPKTEYDDEFSIKSLDPAVILCKVLKCRHAMKDRK